MKMRSWKNKIVKWLTPPTIALYSITTYETIITNQTKWAIITGSLLTIAIAVYIHEIRRMKNEPNTN